MRLDQYLVEKKLFESRSKAQAAIEGGLISLNGKIIRKASYEVEANQNLEIKIQESILNRYVSRGGVKLRGALDKIQLDTKNLVALDIGVSTGGFSDCLLQAGAACVVGLDVGHGQLHEKLKKIVHFYEFEGVHIKDFNSQMLADRKLPTHFDLVVCDVSFISLEKIIPFIPPFLSRGASVVCLVKPQFELEAKHLNKKGIVKDPTLYDQLANRIKNLFNQNDFDVLDYFESSIQGGDGNREFFIYAKIKS